MMYLVYLSPLLAFVAAYLWRHRRIHNRYVQRRDEAVAAGLNEPVSLHPQIDLAKCMGCGSCVKACPEYPEHHVLGLIDGKAHLVEASHCIGHGACKVACPTGAISLVFGTATRGIDIPQLTPNFETNVKGIYISGELGGMGLIRNALTQGLQAVEHIAKTRPRGKGQLDLLIVGAGPAGFAAALQAKKLGLNYLVVEQDSLGGCVFKYPRAKVVMTSSIALPLAGTVQFKRVSKEELLAFWLKVRDEQKLEMRCEEGVSAITSSDSGFLVKTSKCEHRAATVLLAIGRRGTPRTLGVPGEDQSKVVYHMIDPEQYAAKHTLIVGGGDSALEAAAEISDQPNTTVSISYRGETFNRAKTANKERVAAAAAAGRLRLMMASNVKQIDADRVTLEHNGKQFEVRNDAVIVSAGGTMPDAFLRSIGIDVQTKYGTE
jgi:thioredoxin reductase/Fe-S-cluster-containing hydrogenase component 2